MTLLNGILAFGALAFTVPLAIHLLFRNRFRVMDWGAMHLLETVVRVNRRRLQLLHLLLLLLRCLIPILLAYCLARPVLTGFQVLPGDAPRTVVIALDDSQSMAVREASGETRIDIAKRSIQTLLGSLSRRDEVMLLRSSQVSMPVSASGIQDAVEQVRSLKADSGPADLGLLLRAAVVASEEAVYPQRQIVVVGDFATDTIDDASMGALSALAKSLEDKAILPAISFLNLGKSSDQLSNLSVDRITSNAAAVVAGRGGSYSATIRNASDLPVRDVRLTWYLDGAEIGRSVVSVAARSSTVKKLTHRIDSVGVHLLTVSVEHADALLEDNQRSLAVDVIDEINVMLVDGDPAQEPLEGETDYLAIALSPYAFGGEDQPDAVQTKICLRQRLLKQLQEERPDLVVLANVSGLTEQERSSLSSFVLAGGTLVIFDGNQVDPVSYNAQWACEEGVWKLPAALGGIIGEMEGDNRLQQPPGTHHAVYSPWEALRTGNEQPFNDVDIFAYRKLIPLDPSELSVATADSSMDDGTSLSDESAEDRVRSAAIKLWSLGNGDPVAVLARRGAGKVVQFSIPCDTAWATLPLRLVFLPMMQQLVLDLAGNQEQVNVAVGEGIAVSASSLEPTLEDGQEVDLDGKVQYRVDVPVDGESLIEVSEGAIARLLFGATFRRGVYRFRAETPVVDALPVQTETLRLASVAASESVLRDADPERLEAAARLSNANIYDSIDALSSDDRQRRFGREIWRWLLAGLLALLIGELLLQQRAVASVSSMGSKAGAV